MNKGFKFHHYGIAVKEFKHAENFYTALGYNCTKQIHDELQNVYLKFLTCNGMPNIELVKPVNNTSPISKYLSNYNELIYHTCYEIDLNILSIDSFFGTSKKVCVSKPKPAILFNNRNVSFYYVSNVGLIEILEL